MFDSSPGTREHIKMRFAFARHKAAGRTATRVVTGAERSARPRADARERRADAAPRALRAGVHQRDGQRLAQALQPLAAVPLHAGGPRVQPQHQRPLARARAALLQGASPQQPGPPGGCQTRIAHGAAHTPVPRAASGAASQSILASDASGRRLSARADRREGCADPARPGPGRQQRGAPVRRGGLARAAGPRRR